MPDSPKVFISYSHDSDEHRRRVLDLADRLRAEGLDVSLDQFEVDVTPRWMVQRIEESRFVLVVCTETYKKRFEGKESRGGLGADFEGKTITQEIYERRDGFAVPIFFEPDSGSRDIPKVLRGLAYYRLPKGYDALYRRLTGQHDTPAGPVGEIRKMPPKARRFVTSPPSTKTGHGGSLAPAPRAEESTASSGRVRLSAGAVQTTILVLAAGPSSMPALSLRSEMQCIQNQLDGAVFRDRFNLRMQPVASPKGILSTLLSVKPTIVHFCGHGSDQAGKVGLVLEGPTGAELIVGTEALENFFENFSDHVRCVVLNACYSKNQAEAISRHIDYVVGMEGPVSDATALTFTEAFYYALGAGTEFPKAFAVARDAIQLAGLDEHLVPCLHVRSGAEPTLLSEEPEKSSSFPSAQTPAPTDKASENQIALPSSKRNPLKPIVLSMLLIVAVGLAGLTIHARWQRHQVQILNNQAIAYFQQQRFDEARETLQRCLEMDPKFVEAITNLAQLENSEGNRRAAEAHFRRAVQLEPSVALHHFNLGQFLLQRRDLGEALDALARAVELDAEYAEAFNELGRVNLQMGRWYEARDALEKGLDSGRPIQPTTLASLNKNLAGAFLGLGDPKAALSHLSDEILSGLDQDSSIREALFLKAQAFAELERTHDACRELDRFETKNGKYSRLGPEATKLADRLDCSALAYEESPSQGDAL